MRTLIITCTEDETPKIKINYKSEGFSKLETLGLLTIATKQMEQTVIFEEEKKLINKDEH